MYTWSALGVCLVLYIIFRFFQEIGKSFPILELILMIAGLQWILGAFNAYRLSVEHYKYYMRIDEESYMSFVVPAFLVFTIILLFRTKKYKITLQFNPTYYVRYGRYILLIGVLADISRAFVPPSLMFLVYLVSSFKFVGAGILLFSDKKEDRIFFYGSLLYLGLSSVYNAMFHDFILWGLFLFLIWAIKNKPSVKIKLFLVMSGLLVITAIQIVKSSFRAAVWGGSSDNKIELIVDSFQSSYNDTYLSTDEKLSELNVRLNQGWIIAAIMHHVPKYEAYAAGSTIKEAVFASVLPRFISSNKKIAGGQDNFKKYTGLALGIGTSMGLSILGEAYANFGVFGGVVFMAIWAWFLSWYWRKLAVYVNKHPLLLLFLPLLFLQVVKAETELVVVLNHLVKASIVVWLFFIAAKKYFNWKI
jgi:hypothetical protein